MVSEIPVAVARNGTRTKGGMTPGFLARSLRRSTGKSCKSSARRAGAIAGLEDPPATGSHPGAAPRAKLTGVPIFDVADAAIDWEWSTLMNRCDLAHVFAPKRSGDLGCPALHTPV